MGIDFVASNTAGVAPCASAMILTLMTDVVAELEVDEQSGTKQKKSGGFVCRLWVSLQIYLLVWFGGLFSYIQVSFNAPWKGHIGWSIIRGSFHIYRSLLELFPYIQVSFECAPWKGHIGWFIIRGSFHIYRSLLSICWSILWSSFHIYRSRLSVHLGKAISLYHATALFKYIGLLYGAPFIYTGLF